MCHWWFIRIYDRFYHVALYCDAAAVDRRGHMIQIVLFVLLGSSLLIFIEEREWQAYVKLALFIIVSASVLKFFA